MMKKSVPAVLVCGLLFSASQAAFDLAVNQLQATQWNNSDFTPTLFFDNTSGSEVVIDSYTVEEINVPGREYHLQFELFYLKASGDTVKTQHQYERDGSYRHGTNQREATVPAGEKLMIANLELDLCIWCSGIVGLPKQAAIGDEIALRLTFYHAGDHDNVLIESKERVGKPEKPGGLEWQAMNESSIKLSWTKTDDATTSQYIVFRNGEPIDTLSDLTLIDTGLRESQEVNYRLQGVNNVGMVSDKSEVVIARTKADKTAPVIDTAGCFKGATSVWIIFDEPLDKASAENAGNYTIDQGISVSKATLLADWRTVELTVGSLTKDKQYTATVKNVRDLTEAKNALSNATVQFKMLGVFDDFGDGNLGPWTFIDSDNGDPSSVDESNGQLTLTGKGNDTWENSTEFVGVYRDIGGEFDVSVKVVSMNATDTWSRRGIMVANDFNDLSKGGFGFICVSKGGSVQTAWDTQADANIDQQGGPGTRVTVSYPVWLRIKREGDGFRAFYKENEGDQWTETNKVMQPRNTATSSQICLYTCSHDGNTARETVFDDFSGGGNAVAPKIVPWEPPMSSTAPWSAGEYGIPTIYAAQNRIVISAHRPWYGMIATLNGRIVETFAQNQKGSYSISAAQARLQAGNYLFIFSSNGSKTAIRFVVK
ncbi:MAG: hypothetical protein GF398_08465 [Chitinivibrionales bacterium]|nr:hypothetical protein [Chitinivibrionales bacterium]